MTGSSLLPTAWAFTVAFSVALTDSTAATRVQQVDLKVQVIRDVSEPYLMIGVGLVTNASDARLFGWSSIPLDQRKPCSGWQYDHSEMRDSDPRLSAQVMFNMPPGSWYASWHPYWRPDLKCELLGTVSITSKPGGQVTSKISSRAKIPDRPSKPSAPTKRGMPALKFETMVWGEVFMARGREPSGESAQLQLLIRNEAAVARTIAITNRKITCDKSAFAFVVGPGAGHPAITSGPIEVSAGGWGVLAQRIRGSGDLSKCSYQVAISETLGTNDRILQSDGVPAKHWIEVATVKGQLVPVGKLEYLGPTH